MMVVVPALTKSESAEHEVVSALVARFEGAAAPQVTNRIDAPSHVMNQEDPRQSAPQQAG
jgi:hypothetical protein